jgi:hypothetical protein
MEMIMKKTFYAFVIYFLIASKFVIGGIGDGTDRSEKFDVSAQLTEISPRIQSIEAISVDQLLDENCVEAQLVEVVDEIRPVEAMAMSQTNEDYLSVRLREVGSELIALRQIQSKRLRDPYYALDRLDEMGSMMQFLYGDDADELVESVKKIREIQVLFDRYAHCESLRIEYYQLRRIEIERVGEILRRLESRYLSPDILLKYNLFGKKFPPSYFLPNVSSRDDLLREGYFSPWPSQNVSSRDHLLREGYLSPCPSQNVSSRDHLCDNLLDENSASQASPPKIFEEEISLQETSRWLCMKNSQEFSSEVDLL